MKLKVKSKLILSYLVINLFVFGFLVLLTFYIKDIKNTIVDVTATNMDRIKVIKNLQLEFSKQKRLVMNYSKDNESWYKTYDDNLISVDILLQSLKDYFVLEKGEIIINEIESYYNNSLNFQKEIVDLYQEDKINEAKKELTGKLDNVFSNLNIRCKDLMISNDSLINNELNILNIGSRNLYYLIVGIALILILISIVFTIIMNRSIKNPILELVLDLKGIAKDEKKDKLIMIKNLDELDVLGVEIKNTLKKINLLDRELQLSRLSLYRSEKLASLGRLSAGLVHEIRSPLTSIKMFLSSLEKSKLLNKDKINDLNVVMKEIKILEKLVQDFLDFAKPSRLTKSQFSLNDLLDNILRFLQQQIKLKRMVIKKRYNRKIIDIFADKDKIHIALFNIIMNGIESIPGGGDITITTDLVRIKSDLLNFQNNGKKTNNVNVDTIKTNNTFYKISIADSGIGISDKDIKNIFDPFFTTKKDGVGLGLSTANMAIEQHNGRIEYGRNLEKGSIFTIFLPVNNRGLTDA